MTYWFQNLNKKKNKLFHFRGSFGKSWNKTWLHYEFSSGPSLKLKYGYSDGPQWTIGLLFFTAYLTSPYLKMPFLTLGRDYGFYVYKWAIVWSWHAKPFESSSRDPWWMHQYLHIDEWFLGKRERLEDEGLSVENVWFSIGDKEFKIDKIQWKRSRSFRRFIPYSLYHHTWYSVKIEIENPPMVSGKGENSWDCGDDGIFAMSRSWDLELPGWNNRMEMASKAVDLYMESVLRDLNKYGGSSGERGISKGMEFKFIGWKKIDNANEAVSPA